MQNQPLFSVLIANYNNGKYLMEAIESVRLQTYTNWEIILVDDASADNSKELYRELEKDKRIHIYYNEQNKGCGYTKRRCAEMANGEICGFLDADDVLMPKALEIMVSEHYKYPEASLVYSKHIILAGNLKYQKPECGKNIPKGKSLLDMVDGGVTHYATFKSSYYKKTLGINTIFRRAVDQDLYLKLEEVGILVFVDVPLYIYRQETGNNISLGLQNKHKALCWDMLAMVEACKRRNISIDDYAFARVLYEMDSVAQEASWKKEVEIRSSKVYRLGAIFAKPIKAIKKIFS